MNRTLSSHYSTQHCKNMLISIETVLFLAQTQALLIGLLASNSTPFSLSTVLSLIPYSSSLHIFSSIPDFSAQEPSPDLIFDYSYSPSLSLYLLESALNETAVICMYFGCPEQEIPARLRPQEYSSQLAMYMQRLNFTKAFLIAHSEGFYGEVAYRMSEGSGVDFSDKVYVATHVSSAEIENIIGKLFKPSGHTIAVFLVNAETARIILQALEIFHVYTAGYGYIFAEEAAWSLQSDGVIYVTDSPTALVSSQPEYEASILVAQLAILQEVGLDRSNSAKEQQIMHVMALFRKQTHPLALSNINSGHHLVSTSEGTIGRNILFPGKTYLLPVVAKPILEISVDYEGLNYDGSAYSNANTPMRGYAIAYSDVNHRSDLLPSYTFRNHTLSFGAQSFNFTWAIRQITANREKLGLMHHSIGLSEATIGVNQAMHQLGVDIPITSVALAAALGSRREYPRFYRMSYNAVRLAEAMIGVFNQFGWKRTAIIYSNSPEDTEFYAEFLRLSTDFGIEIANLEANRLLPLPFSSHETEANGTISDLLASSVRIIILASPESGLIAERMYDLGARGGDYMVWFYYGLEEAMYTGSAAAVRKRRTVAAGGMMISDRYFVGREGERVRELLREADGDRYQQAGCAMYDAVMVLAHAIEFMLSRGLHFELGSELMGSIRRVRLIGCTGIVELDSTSNDRIPYEYSLINVHFHAENDSIALVPIATYSPSHLISLSQHIHFPDSWPKLSQCPYYLRNITSFPNGIRVGILICAVFGVFTTLLTLLIWRGWWDVSIALLINKYSLSVEDILALICMPIEFLQILAVAPSINFEDLLRNSLNWTNLEWEKVLNVSNEVYWTVEIACFLLISLYISLVIIKFFDLDAKLGRFPQCKAVLNAVDLLLPTYSNLLYLPATCTLLSTFTCYHSTSDHFTASFLNRDCLQRCWTGIHLKFAIFSSVFLIIYVPIAVFTRPIWQEMQENLHVKILPFSLLMKTVFLSGLVAASVGLKGYYRTAHAVVYISLTTLYLFFIFLVKPYNYER